MGIANWGLFGKSFGGHNWPAGENKIKEHFALLQFFLNIYRGPRLFFGKSEL